MITQELISLSPELLGISSIILFLLLMVVIYLGMRKQDWSEISGRSLRSITAYKSLRYAVFQAIETGKRVHLTLGSGGINGLRGGAGFAGLVILRQVTKLTAHSDRPTLATSGDGTLAVLSQDSSHHAFKAALNESRYHPTMAHLSGVYPFAYAAGSLSVISDEQVSTTVLVGHFGSEIALIADASNGAGCTTIAGTDNLSAQAITYVLTEDHLIGEEVYVGGAYTQAGLMHLVSIRAQDYFRWIVVVMIIIGVILKFAGWK